MAFFAEFPDSPDLGGCDRKSPDQPELNVNLAISQRMLLGTRIATDRSRI
jgi:hypothetical protein